MPEERPELVANYTVVGETRLPYDPTWLRDDTNGTVADTPATAPPGPDLGYTIVIGALLGLMIVVTLLGNCLVIAAVASTRRLRSVTNYFVVSLAIADITVAVLVMPYALFYEIYAEWRFGWVFCYFWISCDVTCCTASILHLCVIALDRYLAITQPFSYHNKMSKKRALLMIIGVWVCSTAISFVPIYLGWFADSSIQSELYVDSPRCGLFVNKIYAVISSATSFYIPLLVMIFAYVKIFRIARRQAAEIRKLESSFCPDHSALLTNGARGDINLEKVRKSSKKLQRDSKAIKTLGTLVGLFCVSWLPFFLVYIIDPFCESCTVPSIVISVITWLGYMNSCINPCVYAFLNRDFRVAFRRILSCGGRCDRNLRYHNNCDLHPGSGCQCDTRGFAARRQSSSSSGVRTPHLPTRERLKLEVRRGAGDKTSPASKVSPAGKTSPAVKFTSAGRTTAGGKTSPAGRTTAGGKTSPAGRTTAGGRTSPAGRTTAGGKTSPAGRTSPAGKSNGYKVENDLEVDKDSTFTEALEYHESCKGP